MPVSCYHDLPFFPDTTNQPNLHKLRLNERSLDEPNLPE